MPDESPERAGEVIVPPAPPVAVPLEDRVAHLPVLRRQRAQPSAFDQTLGRHLAALGPFPGPSARLLARLEPRAVFGDFHQPGQPLCRLLPGLLALPPRLGADARKRSHGDPPAGHRHQRIRQRNVPGGDQLGRRRQPLALRPVRFQQDRDLAVLRRQPFVAAPVGEEAVDEGPALAILHRLAVAPELGKGAEELAHRVVGVDPTPRQALCSGPRRFGLPLRPLEDTPEGPAQTAVNARGECAVDEAGRFGQAVDIARADQREHVERREPFVLLDRRNSQRPAESLDCPLAVPRNAVDPAPEQVRSPPPVGRQEIVRPQQVSAQQIPLDRDVPEGLRRVGPPSHPAGQIRPLAGAGEHPDLGPEVVRQSLVPNLGDPGQDPVGIETAVE